MNRIDGGITAPKGFIAGGLCCGIKNGVSDLGILVSQGESSAAGTFTTNLVKAAPVLVSSQQISRGKNRAVVVNSGNANACTGERGMKDAWQMVEETAATLRINPQEVLVCSTGIIGEPLPIDKIKKGIHELGPQLSPKGNKAFAQAILTTDKNTKEVALEVPTSQGTFRVGGAAKGAGMVHPHMATMLAFITTDLEIVPPTLQRCLKEAVELSFNRISIDGDTSTNDTALILANSASGLKGEGKNLQAFQEAIKEVCKTLASMMVKDGEGATKAVKIMVKGSSSPKDGEKAARRLANSLLVKTALYGEDPNWGRLMAALGSSGCLVDPLRVKVWIGDTQVVQGGEGMPGAEEKAHRIMKQRGYTITLDLGLGSHEYWIWTCDLSYNYIRINAEYRS